MIVLLQFLFQKSKIGQNQFTLNSFFDYGVKLIE